MKFFLLPLIILGLAFSGSAVQAEDNNAWRQYFDANKEVQRLHKASERRYFRKEKHLAKYYKDSGKVLVYGANGRRWLQWVAWTESDFKPAKIEEDLALQKKVAAILAPTFDTSCDGCQSAEDYHTFNEPLLDQLASQYDGSRLDANGNLTFTPKNEAWKIATAKTNRLLNDQRAKNKAAKEKVTQEWLAKNYQRIHVIPTEYGDARTEEVTDKLVVPFFEVAAYNSEALHNWISYFLRYRITENGYVPTGQPLRTIVADEALKDGMLSNFDALKRYRYYHALGARPTQSLEQLRDNELADEHYSNLIWEICPADFRVETDLVYYGEADQESDISELLRREFKQYDHKGRLIEETKFYNHVTIDELPVEPVRTSNLVLDTNCRPIEGISFRRPNIGISRQYFERFEWIMMHVSYKHDENNAIIEARYRRAYESDGHDFNPAVVAKSASGEYGYEHTILRYKKGFQHGLNIYRLGDLEKTLLFDSILPKEFKLSVDDFSNLLPASAQSWVIESIELNLDHGLFDGETAIYATDPASNKRYALVYEFNDAALINKRIDHL